MMSTDSTGILPGSYSDTDNNILRGPGHSSYTESKWDRQMTALKKNFGPSSVLALVSTVVAAVAAVVAILVAVGSPMLGQARTNAEAMTSINNLKDAVRANKEEQAKALADGLARIESAVNRSVDLAQQNREDLRELSERVERRVDKVETLSQSNWNKMTEVSNRMGIVEAKQAGQKEK